MIKIENRADFERFEHVGHDLEKIKTGVERERNQAEWSIESSCDYPGQVFRSEPKCAITVEGTGSAAYFKEADVVASFEEFLKLNNIKKHDIGYLHQPTNMKCQLHPSDKSLVFYCFSDASAPHYPLEKPY